MKEERKSQMLLRNTREEETAVYYIDLALA